MTLDRRGFTPPAADRLETLPDGTYRAWVAGMTFNVSSPEERTWVVVWKADFVPPTGLDLTQVQHRLAVLLGGTVVFQDTP